MKTLEYNDWLQSGETASQAEGRGFESHIPLHSFKELLRFLLSLCCFPCFFLCFPIIVKTLLILFRNILLTNEKFVWSHGSFMIRKHSGV